MKRQILALTAGVFALSLLVAGPAVAQQSPNTTGATTTSVLGSSTTQSTTTTTEPTTTTEAEETTTTEAEETTTTVEAQGSSTSSSEPQQLTSGTTPPAVKGSTTGRLPITGGDIGGAAVVGLALTGAGIALAFGARRRRVNAEASS